MDFIDNSTEECEASILYPIKNVAYFVRSNNNYTKNG